jgi:hypothetical protein
MKYRYLLPVIGVAISIVAVFVYYSELKRLQSINYEFNVADEGFASLTEHYSDSLLSVNRYFDYSLENLNFDSIQNDTLKWYLFKQRAMGRYFIEYKDGMSYNLYLISEKINGQQKLLNVLLIVVVVGLILNSIYFFLLRKF